MSLLIKPENLEIPRYAGPARRRRQFRAGADSRCSDKDGVGAHGISSRTPFIWLRELRKNAVRTEGQTVETNPGRISQSIPKGRGYGNNRGFTRGFCAKRTVGIVGISKENLGSGNIGERRNPVIAKRGIQHFPGGVEDHALEQTAPDTLRNRPFDLPATLHGIEDHAGIRGVNTLQNANLPGNPVNGDAKAMHIKAGGAR